MVRSADAGQSRALGSGHGRRAPYNMISWFIAVLMLRLGRRFLARSEDARGARSGAGARVCELEGAVRVTVIEVVVRRREVSVERVEVCARTGLGA